MIKAWFKEMLRELFDERIDTIAADYVEKKVGSTIEKEIQGALRPSIKQIEAMNADIKNQLDGIRQAFDADVKTIKTTVNESVAEILTDLPAKMAEIELDLGNVSEHVNEKIQETLTREIYRSSYNQLVDNVRAQFNTFCSEFDFVSGLRKDNDVDA